MGCDIHVFVEELGEAGWQAVPIPEALWEENYYRSDQFGPYEWNVGSDQFGPYEWNVGRKYWLFGWLAGVRHPALAPVAAGRGVPDDASEIVRRFGSEDANAHSHSWCTLLELLEHEKWKELFSEIPLFERMYLKFQEPLADKVRFVFWFDN